MFKFESKLKFYVKSYSASHGILILNSTKIGLEPTIQITFSDVIAVKLIMYNLNCLEIKEVSELDDDFANIVTEIGHRFYNVRSDKSTGLIVGGTVTINSIDL